METSGFEQGYNLSYQISNAHYFGETKVDYWEALISKRSYKDAWPKEKVLAYIRKESGKSFDPKIVDVFLKKFAGK
ncbi:MAG: hypothetical protein HN922_13080 [Anaerolineae bacterium]|nr:hypothetical protein [Anaerolineae bacterium]MBT7781729.1 hypothetical protein [Anaerolineae bacterium]